MSKKRKAGKEQQIGGINNKTREALQNARKSPLNHKQSSVSIGMTKTQDRKSIQKVLNELSASGEIEEVNRGRYILNPNNKFFTRKMEVKNSVIGYMNV